MPSTPMPSEMRDARRFAEPDTPPQVVVITGASSGIGRATAQAFAAEGARLVLAARGAEALAAVAAECEAAGAQAIAVPTDVADATAVQTLAETAIERFGHIDVWVNNVGTGAVGRFDITPIEAHRRVVESNLIGHMNGAHAVLPHFRGRRRGTLVNMISVGGWAPVPYAAAYAASKYGLRGFSDSIRAELADLQDVHVCDVYPTFVDTPGLTHGANYTGRTIKGPPGLLDPRRVARAIVSLTHRPRPVTALGAPAWPAYVASAIAPNLVARSTLRLMDRAFAHADPAAVTDGNLHRPTQGHAVDGGQRQPAARAGLLGLAAFAVGYGLWRAARR